ncbi:MAG: alkaline phosphatase family protein [Thermoanaerobaculia bacterium]
MKRLVCSLLLASLLLLSCGRESSSSRVIVLALDGVDPHTVDLLMSEGRMPNFAKMKRDGAYAPLTSEMPLLSPIIWTTVATGKRPDQHRIGHFTAVNPQTGEQLPVTSQMRKTKALWNILSESEKSVAVTGWWATWPAESVNGTIVSDHLAYHFLFQEGIQGSSGADSTGKTHPPELLGEVAPFVVRPQNVGLDVVSRYLDVTQADLDRPFDFHDRIGHFRWAWGASETYKKIGLHLWETRKPDVLMVYIEGVDSTSHLFGHLFRAEGLAGDLADQQRKYGRAVEEMYVHIDAVVGEFMEAMDDRTTLVVLSDHGFELGKLPDDPTTTQDLTRVSEKYHRLRGILYMYGHGVRRSSIDRPSIVDIAPTVLALTGVSPAKDMPGRVLTEVLETPGPERIASYESGAAAATTTVVADAKVDPEVLEKLKSLGYINATSPGSDASLAAVLFQQGRYEEAIKAYAELVAASPDKAGLRSSYAGALGAMKRFDAALEQLDAAIRLDPINVEAYHNRAVIRELKGDLPAAVKDYQAAMRYGSFEPSRLALVRLGASESGVEVQGEAEQRAAELVQRAADAAKRGDYPGANRLLDDAEKTAPRFVLVYQYRSNVAYLSGDIDGAIRAIEKGLTIEPDNQLFRTNLAKLKETKASMGR